MIREETKRAAFKQECDNLFDSYCERGWVEHPERKPIMYNPGDIARAGSQEDTPEAKKTGHKSATSIASRVQRDKDYYQSKGMSKTASVGGVADLTRCTMIIESFSQVPKILTELRQQLPSLQVSICDYINEGGYSAIHLKGLNEQGIPYEVQLHTPESFYLKQISEYEYAHWREFNYQAEAKKIDQIPDPVQRLKAQTLLNEKKAMKDADERECEQVYANMHSRADARISDPEINAEIVAIADSINKEYEANLAAGKVVTTKDNKMIVALDKMFEKKGLSQDSMAAELAKSKLLTKVLPESQGQLIDHCEKVMETIYTPTIENVSAEELHNVQKDMPEAPKIEIYKPKQKEQQMQSNENELQ